jgi:hypothetical protein
MNIYPMLVFLHVLGGVGIFAALALESVALPRLQRTIETADARAWMRLLASAGRLGGIAMLTTLATGIWMMVQRWGPRPWIQIALLTVIAMAVLGGGVTGRRMRRLGKLLPAESEPALSTAFRSIASSATLSASLRMRIAGVVGILGLMTVKPDLAYSLVVVGVAVGAGVVASVRSSRRSEAHSILDGVRP